MYRNREQTFEISFSKSSVWFLDFVEFPQLCKVPHFVSVICKVLESIFLYKSKILYVLLKTSLYISMCERGINKTCCSVDDSLGG